MSEQEEIVRDFLVEALEGLDRLDQELVALEADPGNTSILNSIFRTVHSIKGACGFLGFQKLEGISHAGENLLDSLRSGKRSLNPAITSGLLYLVDAVREILRSIQKTGGEGAGDYTAVQRLLSELNGAEPPKVPQKVQPTLKTEPAPTNSASEVRSNAQATADSSSSKVSSPQEVRPTLSTSSPAPKTTEPSSDEDRKGASSSIADMSLRIDVGLLDQLMNLVGELVLARNQILQFTKNHSDSAFKSTSQRLNLITSELQEGVMKTRMQPISNVWSKFPRIVRDLAKACGKQVRLEMEGKETELDKTIIEAIKDPLTHIIRNSVDHGLETSEHRAAVGKEPEGTISMRAFHQGGHVIIEIADDGGGLNTEKIRAKALERSLISAEQASKMSPSDVHRLIFLPGFSTAEKITNLSGRGVGMDVVKSNIEKIGGTVDISSSAGSGTCLKIKIPLTLAIIPALIVSCNNERYAIPQVSLVELVRVEGAQIAKNVEQIYGSYFYRLRGNLLPLVSLKQELKLAPSPIDLSNSTEETSLNIIVVKADEQTFGLLVDTVHDNEEIVVKPLGKQLKSIPVYAGATIMGDGKVALILDMNGVARVAGLSDGAAARTQQHEAKEAESNEAEKHALLVVQAGSTSRAAIHLPLVDRLEEIDPATIEMACGQKVVQYRQKILPLIDLSEFLTGTPVKGPGPRHVIVFTISGQSVGFIVEKIIDIVEEAIAVTFTSPTIGVSGSAVIQKQVTDILDLPTIVKTSARSTKLPTTSHLEGNPA